MGLRAGKAKCLFQCSQLTASSPLLRARAPATIYLRGIGITNGFQWLDGSFLEEKEPKDLDIVCFFYLPDNVKTEEEQLSLWKENLALFERSAVKSAYFLDAFILDLKGSPEALPLGRRPE